VPAGIFQAGEKALTKPPQRQVHQLAESIATGDSIVSPMQATVVKIAVEPGEKVVAGDLICVLEAMKMEQPLQAHRDGVIDAVHSNIGDTVTSGQLLVTFQPEEH
jgi:acetyl-CoA/propionyl-CoA carboxylase biotin carboxyl carrier protein